MYRFRLVALAALCPAVAVAADSVFRTTLLVESPLFDRAKVESYIVRRIEAGVYDGYNCELCVEDPARCAADPVFAPYKQDDGATYLLVIKKKDWGGLPAAVRDAAVREIIYYTWGHPKRAYSPLDVVYSSDVAEGSVLSHLSPRTYARYLRNASPESLLGGQGDNAYGPNCWYNALSSIVDGTSPFARGQMLVPAAWDRPRFMGPTEFRLHMKNFTPVTEPKFGDIVRYYTDAPVYDPARNVFGGEVHAAVFIGREKHADPAVAPPPLREIALTKNGRGDLDFLIFQDVRGMDEVYLPPPGGPAGDERTRIRKGYFRVKRWATVLDPAVAGRLSDAHAGYLADVKNYAERWMCLADQLPPPDGGSAYSYPANWLILPEPTPAVVEASQPRMRVAPAVKPAAPPRRGVMKTAAHE